MSKELFFIGEPLQFKRGIKIFPPKVKDVISDPQYSYFIKVLTYSQEEIEDEFVAQKKELDNFPTPLEHMLNNCYHNKQYERLCRNAFRFFIKEDVTFLYEEKLIVVGKIEKILKDLKSLDQLIFINELEFFHFQNIIREATGQKIIEPPNSKEHPRVKAMKAKARYRDRVKAKQNAKNGISLYTSLVSICCMGLGITPLNIGEMSYIALDSILRKYQEKEKYELDVDSLLAGADSKKIKPKYWIRNFEE